MNYKKLHLLTYFFIFITCHSKQVKINDIFQAIEINDIDYVNNYIIKSGSINLLSPKGKSLLYLATDYSEEPIVKLLLENGANPEIRNYPGKRTPLMAAASLRNLQIAKLLIKYGAKVTDKDGFGYTPIVYAVGIGRLENINLFIENGANLKDVSNQSLYLFLDSQVLNEMTQFNFLQRLMLEIKFLEYNKIIKLLIENGANPNVKSFLHKETVLHWAVKMKDYRVIEYLVHNGVDINQQDSSGEPPLFSAARNRDKRMMDLLIKLGAMTDIKDKHGFDFNSFLKQYQ